MKHALLLILLTLDFSGSPICFTASAAETREVQIYHCGKDGHDLRDSPCPQSASPAPTAVRYDQPDASEVQAARERARSVAQEADALERHRLATEARARWEAATAGSLTAPRAAGVPWPAPQRSAYGPKPSRFGKT